MKYFYNLKFDKISSAKCNMFLVSVLYEQKSIPNNPYYQHYDYYLMDCLGRVFDEKVEKVDLEVDKAEKLFEITMDGNKFLMNQDLKTIAYGYKKVEFDAGEFGVITGIDDKRNYISRQGELINLDGVKQIFPFSNGLGVVQLDDGKYAYVNEKFEISKNKFDCAYEFFDSDYATVYLNGKFYVVDRNAEIVSKGFDNLVFSYSGKKVIEPFVKGKGFSSTCYDFDGNKLCENEQYVYPERSGVLRTFDKQNITHYFDTETGKKIGGDYGLSSADFRGNMAPVIVGEDENGFIWTVLKKDGSTFKNLYGAASAMSDKLMAVYVDSPSGNTGNYFIVDENENLITKKRFKRVSQFYEGMASVGLTKDRMTYLRESDLKVLEETFDDTNYFSCGYGVVKNNGRTDAITKNGVHLSEISEFAEEIDKDPMNILKMPEEYLDDNLLVSRFYNQAQKNIDNTQVTNIEDKTTLLHQKAIINRFFAERGMENQKVNEKS